MREGKERENIRGVSFDSIFKKYYPRLLTYVSSMLPEIDAADIVQDVFFYLLQHQKKISFDEGFSSYIYKACYSKTIDFLRKKTRGYISLDELEEDLSFYKKIAEADHSLLEKIYSEEFYQQINRLLDQMPPIRKDVFVRVYFEGVKSKAVAQELAIPLRTVESHLYLALKFLKQSAHLLDL